MVKNLLMQEMWVQHWSGKIPHPMVQLSLNTTAAHPTSQLLKPTCPRASARQREKPLQWESCMPHLQRKPACSIKGPGQPKLYTQNSEIKRVQKSILTFMANCFYIFFKSCFSTGQFNGGGEVLKKWCCDSLVSTSKRMNLESTLKSYVFQNGPRT